MDIKRMKELETFLGQLQPTLSALETQYNSQALAMEQNCLNKSSRKENDFVECMLKRQDAYTKAFKSLEYHIAFWKNTTFQCFEQNPNDLNTCKTQSKELLQSYVDKCLKNI